MTLKKPQNHYGKQLDLVEMDKRLKKLELIASLHALDDEIMHEQALDQLHRENAAKYLTS